MTESSLFKSVRFSSEPEPTAHKPIAQFVSPGEITSSDDESILRLPSSISEHEWSSPSRTIILLDFDDTLWPTTWTARASELKKVIGPTKQQIKNINTALEEFLSKALKLGRVVIITLSNDKWLDQHLDQYLGDVKCLFEKVEVISGRRLIIPEKDSKLNDQLLSIVLKRRAMRKALKSFYCRYTGQAWHNVISIGDAYFERDALVELASKHHSLSKVRCRAKCVTLIQEPTPEELCQELHAFTACLRDLTIFNGSLEFTLNKGVMHLEWRKWKSYLASENASRHERALKKSSLGNAKETDIKKKARQTAVV